jgi:hypothetical protein
MTTSAYARLPAPILHRASLRGNEYAWPVTDIPLVIGAARDAGLISVGGQLQFRLPDNGTCECYWIEVDTYKAVPKELPWDERVLRTADVALGDFAELRSSYDFLEEGKQAFGSHLKTIEDNGIDPAETMCFVWYLLDQSSEP